MRLQTGSSVNVPETTILPSDALVPAEIGEPKVGRRGLAARDGGQRRIETGQNCPEQFWTAPALPRRGESQGGDESRRVEPTAG